MNWKERINICKKLLIDIGDMLPELRRDEKEELAITAQTIEDYVSSDDFKENREIEKDIDSWNILISVMGKCAPCMEYISNKLFPNPPKYVTLQEAHEKLIEEYGEGIDDGNEEVASMNINDWMDLNGYVLVDENDERRTKQSSDDSDGNVDSKTKF